MRLKSLKLAGFKSFANPTTFNFRHGITAIVGPNGCGKSNVIDAIRWVLGESSAKQLRGGSMSDVIFAGTQNKAAKSLASVELTFEHTQDEQAGIRHELNLYHELSVRRQVNADGKSDYFINGTRCRRRDVVNVFLGTGLGPRSYSVIQQGMIGRIVESSPMQLREYIEEAAGVSRYQVRREETQKKLIKTQENLDRLEDIQSELERQAKRLTKQAKSAQTYSKLQEQQHQVKHQLAVIQLQQVKVQEIQYQQQQDKLESAVQILVSEKHSLNQKLTALNKKLKEEQWLKEDVREKLHHQNMTQQQLEHQLITLESTLNQIESQVEDNLSQQNLIKQNIEKFSNDSKLLATRKTELSSKLDALIAEHHQLVVDLSPVDESFQRLHSQSKTIEDQVKDLERKQALIEQALSQSHLNQQKWQSRFELWLTELNQIQDFDKASISKLAIDSKNLPNFKTLFAQIVGENVNSQTGHIPSAQKNVHLDKPLEVQIDDILNQLVSIDRQKHQVEDQLDDRQPLLTQLSQTLSELQVKRESLHKKQASLTAEYETLHAIVYPIKQQSKLTKASAHEQQSSSNTHKYDRSKIADIENKLAQLPTLSDVFELTEQGENYVSVLDRFLAFWLDSQALNLANNPRAEHSDNQQQSNSLGYKQFDALSDIIAHCLMPSADFKTAKDLQSPANDAGMVSQKGTRISSVLFTTDNNFDPPTLKYESSLERLKLVPMANLIKKPYPLIFSQCYLYLNADADSAIRSVQSANLEAIEGVINQGAIVLTQSGWIMSKYAVMNVSKFDNHVQNQSFLKVRLNHQKRLQELETCLDDVETQLDSITVILKNQKNEYETLSIENEELTGQRDALIFKEHELKQQHLTLSNQQRQHKKDLQRLQTTYLQLTEDKQEINQEVQRLKSSQNENIDELNAWLPRLSDIKAKIESVAQQKQTIETQLLNNTQVNTAVTLELNQVQLEHNNAVNQSDRMQSELKQLQQSIKDLEIKNQTAEQSLPGLKAEKLKVDGDCQHLKIDLEERQALIARLQIEIGQFEDSREKIERQLSESQNQLAESRTMVAVANERIAEASDRLSKQKTLVGVGIVDADRVIAEVEQYDVENMLDEFDNKISQLQHQEQQLDCDLKSIGAVNLAAAAELEDVQNRLLPLATQISDISNSIQKLTGAIDSIDAKTKTLFLDTLTAVNNSLNSLFNKVFGGGQASLTLVTDKVSATAPQSEKWRAGLELMAQPKGKKNSRLAVLSGGEKTLTALSLIFAIFKQHPAPFCVLDEVDAPLDDANVSRFTNLINDLANDVQFIFISHNKLAMQIADELKGITMPVAGVSSLVSVSLQEAVQYVEKTT